jgi:hypothetical protein
VLDYLHNAAKEISSMMATVLSNMDACFLQVLYNAGWTTANANLWITPGLLPHMIQATMQCWLELRIHLQTISNANRDIGTKLCYLISNVIQRTWLVFANGH